ncbi:MAG: TRAP transporter small permease [Firmicutes bacterium]|nr:TRAP transporter small permease [Bacillota bacterium]
MQKVDNMLGKVLQVLATVSLSLTVIITFLQVLFRYVFKSPISWSQEVLMISFVYSILFGAALAVKNKEHLTVDLFDNLSSIKEKILVVIEFIITGTVILILLYFGWELVRANLESGQIVGILPLKKAYVYLAIPLSALFMLYFHIRKVIK